MKTVLMNRNPERASKLGEDLRSMGFEAEDRPLADFRACFRESDIIIYNIPTAIPELAGLTEEDFGSDRPKFTLEANYKDPAFDEAAVSRMRTANPMARHTGGRTWLLYQAMTGYEIFTGEKPDLARMSDVL
jgi:shikimate 5-dehydrogenase